MEEERQPGYEIALLARDEEMVVVLATVLLPKVIGHSL